VKLYGVVYWVGTDVLFDGPHVGLSKATESSAFQEGKNARIISWATQEELTKEQYDEGWR